MADKDTMQKAVLRNFLQRDAKVALPIVEFIMKHPGDDAQGGLGIERTADYKGYFTEAGYQAGVQTDILDKTPKYKTDRLQRSRLRTARKLTVARFSRNLADGGSLDLLGEEAEHTWDTKLHKKSADVG